MENKAYLTGTAVFVVVTLIGLQPTAVVEVSPSSQTVSTGDMFTVNILVEEVEDLGGYEFILRFNPEIVSIDNVEDGGFLGSTGRPVVPIPPRYDLGEVEIGAISVGAQDGPSGDGVLAVVTLRADSVGTSPLTLQSIFLCDTDGVRQDSHSEDGEVSVEAVFYLPLILRNRNHPLAAPAWLAEEILSASQRVASDRLAMWLSEN